LFKPGLDPHLFMYAALQLISRAEKGCQVAVACRLLHFSRCFYLFALASNLPDQKTAG